MEFLLSYAKPKRNKIAHININIFEANNDEICPISQEPINESNLEFLENIFLCANNKAAKGIILDCKHKFNGMYLLYHWTRNRNVLCPVCRGGVQDAYINIKSFPAHFRDVLARKVRSERRKDAINERRENEQAAIRIQEEEDYISMLHFISNCVFFVVQPDLDFNSFMFPCDATIETDGTCILTTNIPSNITYSIGYFKAHILIKSLGINSAEIRTKLPESTSFIFETGNHPVLSVCNNSPFCQYTIFYDPKTPNVICSFKTPFFFLKQVANNHIDRTRGL